MSYRICRVPESDWCNIAAATRFYTRGHVTGTQFRMTSNPSTNHNTARSFLAPIRALVPRLMTSIEGIVLHYLLLSIQFWVSSNPSTNHNLARSFLAPIRALAPRSMTSIKDSVIQYQWHSAPEENSEKKNYSKILSVVSRAIWWAL